MSSCRSCGASILWGITERGKRIPIDPDPVENGNLVVRIADGKRLVRTATDPDDVRYVSHFATCPNAADHRKT